MQVAILFGSNGEQAKQSIETQNDTIKIRTYPTIANFQNFVLQSNVIFDRILITSSVFEAEGLEKIAELKAFMYENSSRTKIVMITPEFDDTGIQELFMDEFDLSIYTDATTAVTDIKFILDCILLKISDINSHYSIVKPKEVKLVSESYAEDEPKDEETADAPIDDGFIQLNFKEPVLNLTPAFAPNKADMQQLYAIADANNGIAEILKDNYYNAIIDGHLNKKRYSFYFGKLDTESLAYKHNRQDRRKQLVKLNRNREELIPGYVQQELSRQKPTQVRLKEFLIKNRVLNSSALFDPNYGAEAPVLNTTFMPTTNSEQHFNQPQQTQTQFATENQIPNIPNEPVTGNIPIAGTEAINNNYQQQAQPFNTQQQTMLPQAQQQAPNNSKPKVGLVSNLKGMFSRK